MKPTPTPAVAGKLRLLHAALVLCLIHAPADTVKPNARQAPVCSPLARAHALKIIAGQVKIPDAPGWSFTPNPDWIAKASDFVSERPATP